MADTTFTPFIQPKPAKELVRKKLLFKRVSEDGESKLGKAKKNATKVADLSTIGKERKIRSVKPTIFTCPEECDRPFSDTGKLSNHRKLARRVLESPTSLTTRKSGIGSGNDAQCLSQGDWMIGEEQENESEYSRQSFSRQRNSNAPLSVLPCNQDCENYQKENNVGVEKNFQQPPSPLPLAPPILSPSKPPSDNGACQAPATDLQFYTREEETDEAVQTLTVLPQPPVQNVPHQLERRKVHFNIPSAGGSAKGDATYKIPMVAGFNLVQSKVLQCPLGSCQLKFPTKGALKNHLECHEGLKPFACPVCFWGYETDIQLLEHFSIKHSKEPVFKCGGCGKLYKTKRGRDAHKILKHCNTPGSSSSAHP